MRRQTGQNRHEIKFANHSRKSPAKRKAMGWGKAGNAGKVHSQN